MQMQILHLLLVSIFQFFSVLQSLTHPSDIAALKSFKSSINPTTIPSWSCLASWNFDADDPCSLPHRTHFICGLTCNSGATTTRITGLTLDPAGYSGTLSPLLSSLSELTHLDLSDNAFHGPIPSSLSSLTKLETLILRSNSFSGDLPPSLTNLASLETLDLSHNSLSGQLPATMNSLTSLRILDLSFNKLAGNLPKLPPNLAELALKANFLSGSLSETSFHGLNRLEVVELSANSLTGALQGWFFLLPSIQQVNLANNSLTGIQISRPIRNGGGYLVAVDLSFNKIDGYLPAEFALFPSLSSLSLRFNRLRGPIPWQFGNKASLRRLFLDGNFFNGTAPKGFFSNNDVISGSFGDNCLERCPAASRLCELPQKPSSVCRQAYSKRPRGLEV